MKKILTLIFAVIFASQFIVFPVSAKTSNKPEHSWKVVNGLGIADFEDSEKEEKITRAEFAQFVATALRITSIKDKSGDVNSELFDKAFYAGMQYDGYSEPVLEDTLYEDVDSGHQNYDAIYALKVLKLMQGDGTGYFHPDTYIKYEEALKVFVMLASYNVDVDVPGAWSTGYINIASDMDITLKGVISGTEITKLQLCQIFYKLFDVEMMEIVGTVNGAAVFKNKDDVTFLNEILGLYAFDGQLEATENSTLTLPYSSKGGNLVINGISYKNKAKIPVGNMLGREVEAYRTEDGEIVFLTTIDDDDITVIKSDDILGYNDGKLSYLKNGRTKSVDISGLPVIYNGVAASTYTADIFDIYNGSITLTEEAAQNVVIIWEYKDILVSAVNSQLSAIYDDITSYKLDLDEADNTVFIFDASGNEKSLADISENTIISYIENGSYKEVYIGGTKLNGTLKKIDAENNQVDVDGTLYKFTDALVDNDEIIKLQIGVNVSAYKNMFNKIFHIDVGARVGENSGILMEVKETSDGDIVFKVFDNSGNFVTYPCADRVIVTDSRNNTQKASGYSIISSVDGYSGYVIYTLNSDGNVTRIQIPLKSKDYLKAGEEKVYEKPFALTTYSPFRSAEYRLGSSMFLNADVEIYSVPTNIKDKSKYERITLSGLNDLEYFSGIAYFKNEDKPIPEAVVTRDKKADFFSLGDGLKVVTKIRTGLRDDEICKEVELTSYTNNTTETVYSLYENGVCGFDNVKTLAETGETYSLSVGDIVFCCTKNKSQELSSIRLLYSCNMESPAGPRGNKGWLPDFGYVDDLGKYSNKFLISKSVYDSWKSSDYEGFFDFADSQSSAAISPLKEQNPFSVNSEGVLFTNPNSTYSSGRTMMLGYVVDYVDGFIKITTQDLSCESYNPDEVTTINEAYMGINFERWYNMVKYMSSLCVVEYHYDEIIVRSGYPEDIFTYKKSGHECSKMLIYGTDCFVIIKDYR